MKIGEIGLRWLGHSSFIVEGEGKRIYIDPYKVEGEKADIIMITHPHYDHCSVEDINKIVKDGTVIVIPADCQSKIARLEGVDMKILGAGQSLDIDGVKIGAIPAYNINKEFHPRDEGWLGYVIKINDTVLYHAGDTDKIPEMDKLQGKVGVALLPVSGVYTMTAEEAASAASVIRPSLAIPMHWGSVTGDENDAKRFVELCEEARIMAEILEGG
jgi:L-ascorbate metabolism protein UlaG (beta-lactamase superfamily)